MKSANSNLHAAKSAKNDEFYTQLADIENELRHYSNQFRGKVVLCNCDDPRVSNFFHYFFMNFRFLGLKKLIATCYKNQQWDLFSTKECEKAVYIVYDGPKSKDDDGRMPKDSDITVRELEGDGDFRSAECKAFLELADIVVTNPPFSLFREFVALMNEYDKKFLIIGSKNALKYKEIFPAMVQNEMWLGVTSPKEFLTSNNEKQKFGNIGWFTNMPTDKDTSKEPVILIKKYNPADYPKYDNYDAINCDKVTDIPVDYFDEIGVPITFMDKWNPCAAKDNSDIVTINDFEIIGGFNNSNLETKKEYGYVESTNTEINIGKKKSITNAPVVNKKALYYRIIIRRKK